jgi:hypothetical protein
MIRFRLGIMVFADTRREARGRHMLRRGVGI